MVIIIAFFCLMILMNDHPSKQIITIKTINLNHMIIRKVYVITISLVFCTLLSFSQQVKEPLNTPIEWSKPIKPFKIAGNLYYVGTYDLACYLITTNKGNILINTGLANSLSTIKNSIEKLGFKFNDTKILLTTQAHYDHMGAMADIKKLTGAKMMINAKDAEVMADGGKSDYALGGKEPNYKPLKADRLLQDGDSIMLGNMRLTMLHHPGHTKGSSSFVFNVNQNQKSYKVLIANLPSIVTDEDFSKIKAYPTIEQHYAYTFKAMKDLTFDIWLSSHASQFNMHQKLKSNTESLPEDFIDQKGYEKSLADLEENFIQKIKK